MYKTSFIERYPQNKKSTVAIKPYFDPSISNLGLEKYGQCMFDNTAQEEPITCLEQYGIIRFVTGLNEHAPEVSNIVDDEERAAKIKDIRTTVAHLEKTLVNNIIVDLEDPAFWNKVKLLKPDNLEFWDKIKIRVGNDPVFLDASDPYDLIKLYTLEAGGFSLVAPSLEAARSMNKPPKFYLDKIEDTASTKTEVKKLRNKALAELELMFNKNQNKMFYVAKILDPSSAQYKKSTPNDIIYENLDNFINGGSIERDKRKAAEKFNTAVAYNMEELKIRAIVKDATVYKMYATKSDGFIYDIERGILMGKTQADVIAFLKNPLNEDALVDVTKKLEKYWNA